MANSLFEIMLLTQLLLDRVKTDFTWGYRGNLSHPGSHLVLGSLNFVLSIGIDQLRHLHHRSTSFRGLLFVMAAFQWLFLLSFLDRNA